MARMAKSGLKPPIEMNADNPVRMSQMASNRKPIFLVMFMKLSFSEIFQFLSGTLDGLFSSLRSFGYMIQLLYDQVLSLLF